jgi:hypothetical protein
MSIHRSIRLLASLVIACHASCSSSDAERHQGKLPGWGDDELILAAYRVEVDPLDPKVFSFYPLGRLGDPVSSEVGQVHGALANGDETVSVWYESDFAITNCAPGVCGCDEGQGDIPAWYQGDCYDEGYVDYGMGRVVISNSTSDSTFVDPALVLTNFDPPGAAVFQQPPETSGSCTDYRATRSASPYQGSYYLRYNDIGPSGCDKGYSADRWIVAADTPGTPFRFDAFLLVDRLDGGPAFDADIFSEPIERPAKPEVRTPGLSSTATAGETCTGVVSGRSVLCVAPGGGGSGTASAPFGSIQAAVNAASAGDLIQIAQGSYSESVTIETNALTLRGGFTGAGDFSSSLPSERVTTLTAPSNGTALSIILADDVTILGLRLAKSSRGLLVDQSNARIEHCLIEENESQGALEASGGNFELYYSVIRYNRTDEGPIGIFYGRATVVGNDIHDNEGTSYHGGALYIAGSQTYILGNLIRNNRSLAYGAGILIFDPGSRAVLAHNVVTGNQAGDAGSGVFIDDGAEALLVNELIYGNGCPRDGGAGLYVDGLDVSTPSAAYVVNFDDRAARMRQFDRSKCDADRKWFGGEAAQQHSVGQRRKQRDRLSLHGGCSGELHGFGVALERRRQHQCRSALCRPRQWRLPPALDSRALGIRRLRGRLLDPRRRAQPTDRCRRSSRRCRQRNLSERRTHQHRRLRRDARGFSLQLARIARIPGLAASTAQLRSACRASRATLTPSESIMLAVGLAP